MVKGKRHIPSKGRQNLVTFSILINGERVSRTQHILKLAVHKAVNRIATAILQIRDGAVADQDFAWSSSELFVPGHEITIRAGYRNQEEVLFQGIIVRHAVRLWRTGQTVLDITAKDKAAQMIMGRRNTIFENMRDSEAFEEIAGRYELGIETELSNTVHEQLVQYQSSDWDFLVCRAEAGGMVVINSDNRLVIKRPVMAEEPVLSLVYGATIFETEGVIDVREQFGEVYANSWDPATQKPLAIGAEQQPVIEAGNLPYSDLAEKLGSNDWQLYHSGVLDEPELQSWAEGVQQRSRLAKIRGQVCCQGTVDVLPGDTVELRGLGDRMNGLAYVSGVQHKLGDGNWLTYLTLGLENTTHHALKKDVSAPAAAGLLPSVSGLHTGIVTQLAGDPAGEDRIQIRLPMISNGENGMWARLATLDAGKDRGTFFLPEIGDEVLVSFLNDDPRQPVILGMLHSSAKPAPLAASDDNHVKGFISRSGIRLLFNDEDTTLQLDTPQGKKLVLDENKGAITLEDEYGNKIAMDSSGIRIESGKDLMIKAVGDVAVEGLNVDAKASAALRVTGSISAEISASGNTVVKGSLVQIN
ncbi:type VI secretion system tip protein VgrG [Flavilitoribacter nigricans]|uniref:Type IV secretion protein Rhs n=1 Tax=Flavilitoribacter nigricans (strain ATCC 23147 / DSM 23189 / NBRC 102662 / NCIMB 1420 / SS-2) TaxID=1122177 RepID=A0A2D0MYA0_FLAN2|nr:type VI secretion system tip protein VgrG [Flavilitoribacter nigricans]PHN01261.1 type IV secretion protein Rhs [Flavilitoribacter nigricans DSM 23189 = NBRC 102662]